MGKSDHSTTYMREGEKDGELRPWHFIYVYSIYRKPKPWREPARAKAPPGLTVDG